MRKDYPMYAWEPLKSGTLECRILEFNLIMDYDIEVNEVEDLEQAKL